MNESHLLCVEGLTIGLQGEGAQRSLVHDLDMSLRKGEIVGLIGASGSGKTLTGLALLNLLPPSLKWSARRCELSGIDLRKRSAKEWQRLRGARLGMIFQDPMTSFNPVRKIGKQLSDALRLHSSIDQAQARRLIVEALDRVGIPSADSRYDAYPHEMSGGMRQRAMVALATLHQPDLLIADEPTTALDTTIKLQILRTLKEQLGQSAMIMITHDLGTAAAVCDRIFVMKDGRTVEEGVAQDILRRPQTNYAKELLDAVPRFASASGDPSESPAMPSAKLPEAMLEARNLSLSFPVKGQRLVAVNDVSLSLESGEAVGLVGESGSGKSSLLSMLVGLRKPDHGTVAFEGQVLSEANPAELRDLRRELQFVFQDPYSSLDPRWTIRSILAEPLRAHGWRNENDIENRCVELMRLAELPSEILDRKPDRLSGGQRQRVSIMRALALQPKIIIADEPVSALDVLVQVGIVDLLERLRVELGLGLLIVAHDLALVDQITQRLLVLYLGEIVEQGPTVDIGRKPFHPYTAMLRSAVVDPHDDPTEALTRSVEGEPPSPLDPPSGCPFHPRCPQARDKCVTSKPALRPVEDRLVACHYPLTA